MDKIILLVIISIIPVIKNCIIRLALFRALVVWWPMVAVALEGLGQFRMTKK